MSTTVRSDSADLGQRQGGRAAALLLALTGASAALGSCSDRNSTNLMQPACGLAKLFEDPACGACAAAACCELYSPCEQDAACRAVAECGQACIGQPDSADCSSACVANSPPQIALTDSLQCAYDECPDQCQF